MNPILEGVFPAVITTFNETGDLDLASQVSVVNHLLQEGAHGLALFGNAGEGYTLVDNEWSTLVELVLKEVNGRVPVVVSTGQTGTIAAVNLSKRAEDAGVTAVVVLPPYYLRPDADGLLFYYEAISDAIRIPIMVQDAPLMTQVGMPPALLARMSREVERVLYVKVESPPTAPKISQVIRSTEGQLITFGGLNGLFMIEEIERGARGLIPGSDMTAFYVKLWRMLEEGNSIQAWELFKQILPLIRFELQPGLGVSAMKNNLHSRGIIGSTHVRHPTASLDADSLRELVVLRNMVFAETA
jgi:2-keto-3-deoxy-L-arabinonate dehydratase